MTWERRRNARSYYYRARRVGPRVVKEYLGGGAAGEVAAREDAVQRATRAEQQQPQAHDAMHDQLSALSCQADAIVETALVAAGYHRHHRGPWRRKRARPQA